MNYRMMFVLNSVVALLFGLGFLFVPNRALGLGLALWFAKEVGDPTIQKQKGMEMALLITALAGLVVSSLGTFAAHAVLRTNGWLGHDGRLSFIWCGLWLSFISETGLRPQPCSVTYLMPAWPGMGGHFLL